MEDGITIDINQIPIEKWHATLRELKEEYNITVGIKQDDRSSRRVALLVAAKFVEVFPKGPIWRMTVLEPAIYVLARLKRLECDPLEQELKNPRNVDDILKIWGSNYFDSIKITNLEQWLEPLWSEGGEENGQRQTDFGKGLDGRVRAKKGRGL